MAVIWIMVILISKDEKLSGRVQAYVGKLKKEATRSNRIGWHWVMRLSVPKFIISR